MPLVEGCRQIELETNAAERLHGPAAVGIGLIEIAAHHQRRVDLTAVGLVHTGHSVHAAALGQGDIERLLHARQHVFRQHRLDADRADALDIGMAA